MLELLIAPEEQARVTIVPELPGTKVGELTTAAMESIRGGVRRILPSPETEAPSAELRKWHASAWHALSEDERSRVALAAGPTAMYLLPVVAGTCQALVGVTDPLTAAAAVPGKEVRVRRLKQQPPVASEARILAAFRHVSNPQSRALLGPSVTTDDLPLFAPEDEERDEWRRLLFERALKEVSAYTPETLGDLAIELAERLGCSPTRPVKTAERALRDITAAAPPSWVHRQADELMEINWLDAEMFERFGGSPADEVVRACQA